jgi:hypothetical protein
MVQQFNPLGIFEEGREGRDLIFQTFLDRFRQPRLVTDYNRRSLRTWQAKPRTSFLEQLVVQSSKGKMLQLLQIF